MPDTDTTSGTAGQAVQFGSDVLTELESAVREADVSSAPPAVDTFGAGAEFDATHPELGTPGVPETVPPPEPAAVTESPRITREQAMRIQDIVDRAKADIARIVTEYEEKRAGIAGSLQAQEEEERKRKAQELIAKFQGTPTA